MTAEGRADIEPQNQDIGLITPGSVESAYKTDQLRKVNAERANSEMGKYRKNTMHQKLPTLPQQPSIELITKKNGKFNETRYSKNADIGSTNRLQDDTPLQDSIVPENEYRDAKVSTSSQNKLPSRFSKSIDANGSKIKLYK